MTIETITTAATLEQLRSEIAEACRVLAARDLAPGILGHISLRVDAERVLIRCRGPQERGLAYTTSDDIHLVTVDGRPGAPGELADGYRPPHELPLHTEVLAARPDIDCVLHAHPERVVVADLAGLPILPMVGAFDIPGAALAAGGVPVFGHGWLINDRESGRAVAGVLGDRPAVVMRGHGLTVVGSSPAHAVLRAISIDTLAGLAVDVASAGGTPRPLPTDDLNRLPDLGAGLNIDAAWRYEVARADNKCFADKSESENTGTRRTP